MQYNRAMQCNELSTNQASPPPGTPQALDLNSGVFQTVKAINLSRVMLTATKHCIVGICASKCQNCVQFSFFFSDAGLCCTALNWLELHCGHFSDGVDTIKLRTDLVLNTGMVSREPSACSSMTQLPCAINSVSANLR